MIERIIASIIGFLGRALIIALPLGSLGAKDMQSTTHIVSPPPQKILDHPLHLHLPFKLSPPGTSLQSIKIQDIHTPLGFHGWLVENKDIPVVTVEFMFVDAGSKNEIKGKKGLVALLASLMDEGAGDYTSDDFKKFLITNNINLIVSQGVDNFILGFSVPKTHVAQAFKAMDLILTRLRFDSEPLERIKTHLHLHYTQRKENEGERGMEELEQTLMAGSPYVSSLDDRVADLRNISATDLKDFMKNHFTKNKLIISVCGDISTDELSKLIDTSLKNLPLKATPEALPDVSFQNLGSLHPIFMDIPQSLILFAHPGFKRSDPDYFALDLAMDILGSGELGSRLMNRVREENGLVYGIGITKPIYKHYQLILGNASTHTENVTKVIDLIRSEWKKFIAAGVTKEELDRAKQRSIGLFPLRLGNTQSIASLLTSIQYYNLGIDYLEKRAQAINDVTLERVNKLIQERFKDDGLTFVIVGRENSSHAPIQKIKGKSS